MELPNQIIKQIGLLVDKPIAPKVTKQIQSLILNDNLQQDKAMHIFLNKYRSDMIIYMLKNKRYPNYPLVFQSASIVYIKLIDNILKNILQYRSKMQQIIQIVLMILNQLHTLCQNSQDQSPIRKTIMQIGYSLPIKLVIKKPNLETKELLMQIICSNINYLYSVRYKKIISAVSQNYYELFTKYLICVPSFIKMVEIILNIDYLSKKIINQTHPERADQIQEIYIDLSSKQLYNLTTQTLRILQNNSKKVTNYELHKSCLKVIYKVGDSLNSFRIKQMDLFFKQIDIITILRESQRLISIKGTIDEARKCKKQWQKIKHHMHSLKSEKGTKVHIDSRKMIENRSEPILIENVIALTNNYRLKYQVQNPMLKPEAIDVTVSNNYLKKGKGIGGGKNVSEVFQLKQPYKVKAAYDKIVDNCFDRIQNERFEYKSYVDPQIVISKDVQEEPNRMNDVRQYAQMQKKQNIGDGTIFTSYQQQQDEQIDEINNLIDLAYSYKFSA